MKNRTLMDFCLEAGVDKVAPQWFLEVNLHPKIQQFEPHQLEGLKRLVAQACKPENKNTFAIFDTEGSGKTLVFLTFALLFVSWGNKGVIVVPPVLCGQTDDVLSGSTFQGLNTFVSWKRLDKLTAPKRRMWVEGEVHEDLVIVTYTMFKDLQEFTKRGKRKIPKGKHTLAALGYRGFICDEAKILSSPHSAINQSVAYASRDGFLVLADATPCDPSIESSTGIPLLLSSAYTSERDLLDRHVQYAEHLNFPVVTGYKNIEAYTRNLFENAVRTRPPLSVKRKAKIRRLTLSEDHAKVYDVLTKNGYIWAEDGRYINCQKHRRSHQVQLVSNPKKYGFKYESPLLRYFDECVAEALSAGSPYVIFCWHTETVDALVEHYKALGAVGLNGATSNKEKHVAAFKRGEIKILIVNWQTAGSGLELQNAWYCGFYELPGVVRDMSQPIARLARKGQLRDVTIHIPIVFRTKYEETFSTVSKRSLVLGQVFGEDPYIQTLISN